MQFLSQRFDAILRVGKGTFAIRERPFYFSVKCEMANFFLVNRDFVDDRET